MPSKLVCRTQNRINDGLTGFVNDTVERSYVLTVFKSILPFTFTNFMQFIGSRRVLQSESQTPAHTAQAADQLHCSMPAAQKAHLPVCPGNLCSVLAP